MNEVLGTNRQDRGSDKRVSDTRSFALPAAYKLHDSTR